MATIPVSTQTSSAPRQMMQRALISLVVAGGAFYFVAQLHQQITVVDFLAIACGVAFVTTILLSVLRGPRRFAQALWERIVFTIWVPIACALIVAVFLFRIGFILFKISLKLILAGIVAVAYVLMPIDLIPDFLLGFGQIDDILIVISLAVWAMGAAISESLRASIKVTRPQTPFP